MKKLLFSTLIALVLCSSCEKDPEIEPQTPLELALEEISGNQALLDRVYEETAKRVTYDTLLYVKDKSSSLQEFLLYMSRITNGLFEATVTNQDPAAADVFIKIPTIPGESKHVELLKIMELDDPYTAYANRIADEALERSKSQEEWRILKAYKDSEGGIQPLTGVSVDYEQIMALIQLQDILISSTMSEQEQEEAIEKLGVRAQIPEVLIGLLLPAVQKFSEGASNDPFLNWLNTEVKPAVQGSLDRDLIRRKAFMSFLGGLDVFVNDTFNNEDQKTASLTLMQARYETLLMFLWRDVWNG